MPEFGTKQGNGLDTAQRLRQAASGLLVPTSAAGALQSRGGVIGLGVGAAAGMTRTVATGRAVVPGTFSAKQGVYDYVLDDAKNLTFDDGSSAARVDLVIVRAYDNVIDGSGQTKVVTEIVKGTPGAGTPAVPVSSLVLWQQPVPANASAGTGGLPAGTDRRPPPPTAIGGIPVVADAAARDALLAYSGLTVYQADVQRHMLNVGGTWVQVPVEQIFQNDQVLTGTPGARAVVNGRIVSVYVIVPNVTVAAGAQDTVIGTLNPFLVPASGFMVMNGAPGGLSALVTPGTGQIRVKSADAAQNGASIHMSGTWPIGFG